MVQILDFKFLYFHNFMEWFVVKFWEFNLNNSGVKYGWWRSNFFVGVVAYFESCSSGSWVSIKVHFIRCLGWSYSIIHNEEGRTLDQFTLWWIVFQPESLSSQFLFTIRITLLKPWKLMGHLFLYETCWSFLMLVMWL